MKYHIIIPEGLSFQSLTKEVGDGGRFVLYPYCISLLFAVTLKRLSPAYFIRPGESSARYKTRYNRLSQIFGWWCIPWGIIRTMDYIKLNNAGGLDVTDDIMLNLKETDLIRGVVDLQYVSTVFKVPEKTEVASMKKVVWKKLPQSALPQKLVFAYFLNVPDGEKPFFVVGIQTAGDFDYVVNAFQKVIYTQFLKHVPFRFINLAEVNDFNAKLEKQGLRII